MYLLQLSAVVLLLISGVISKVDISLSIASRDHPLPNCNAGEYEADNYHTPVEMGAVHEKVVKFQPAHWALCLANHEKEARNVRVSVHAQNKELAVIKFYTFGSGHMYNAEELKFMEYKPVIQMEKRLPVFGSASFVDTQIFHILCYKEGRADFIVVVDSWDTGDSMQIELQKQCLPEELQAYGAEDWGHFWPPFGFILYMSYILFDHLGLTFSLSCLIPEAIRRRFRSKKSSTNSDDAQISLIRKENLVFFFLGLFLVLILRGDFKLIAQNQFPKHLIFGGFFMLTGALGYILSTDTMRKKSFPFATPLVFVYLGYAFMTHGQYDSFSMEMHEVFGSVLIGTGIMRAFSLIWPELTILVTIMGHFAGILFVGTDNSYVLILQGHMVESMNYMFLLLNVVVLYTLAVVCFAYVVARWRKSSEGAATQTIPTHHGTEGQPGSYNKIHSQREDWSSVDD